MTAAPRVTERIWWTTYVRLHDVPRWTALGWKATGALRDTNHGEYSELLEWTSADEPKYPEREEG